MKYYILLIFIVLITSCSDNHIHKEIDRDFPNNRWQKSTVKSFDFIIHDSLPSYDIKSLLTHVEGSQWERSPVEINVIAPDKSVITEQVLLRIKDADGKDAGDCVGDYCDMETLALQKVKLVEGKYIVRLKNNFPSNYLPNVIGLGIEISESLPE